ncbi:hypothetical protein ACET57_05260 [Aeromonas veronii]|uniref:hypothetical protein n=1 Tax=Aeromonas TaxID=642 RepID=UPI0038D3016C
MNIVNFVNREQLEGRKAIESFVSHYRHVMSEPLTCPFDPSKTWVWGANRWHGAGRFIKYELKDIVKSLNPDEKHLLSHGSRELIQALILHMYVMNGGISRTKVNSVLSDYLALECVLRERALNGEADFASISVIDLNNTLQKNMDFTFEYLKSIVETFGLLGIIKSQSVLQWINPRVKALKKKDSDAYREKLTDDNSYKLPNYEAVIAAADYFRNQPWLSCGDNADEIDKDFKNVIVSSALTILMMVPARSQDIFEQLSVDCLVSAKVDDTTVYGITWYAKKTDMDHWKLVPSTATGEFENAIKEAIERIKLVTEPARQVFKTWDKECPEYSPAAYQKALENGWIPADFPIYSAQNKVRYSEALMVMLKHQTHASRSTVENCAIKINKFHFRDWLRAKINKSAWSGNDIYTPSFFERIGYEHLELNPDDYNSHAYRHMVNTAARLGGMSEFQVNWWSHRKEMGSVYDHRTAEQKRIMISTGGNFEATELTPHQRLDQINHNLPLTRKNLGLKFELVDQATGGFTFKTPLGTCTHNYSESPCTRSCNCVECPENLHCKGDKRTLKELRKELDDVNNKIYLATSECDSFGLKRLKIRHEIVDGLVKILGDESPLEDGALVMLTYEQAPDSGLIYQAKEIAKQIENGNNLTIIKHAEAIKQLGLARVLPKLESSERKLNLLEQVKFEEFLSDYNEDDE